MTPTVSFVVPCYRLAHLLGQCIRSVLDQTYQDWELLVMDDQSPDHTADVARSFRDPRIRHVRNEVNLGHLRNYNRGIELSRGKYIWLISADDYLRTRHVLDRYVQLLERAPNVGYVFCPAVSVRDGVEEGVVDWCAVHGEVDRIIPGRELLKRLLFQNTIVAASGMARRACYETIDCFPLDMPWAGDWYLWCVFALHHDVGYFAEPMVCYRQHGLSMTNILMAGEVEQCRQEAVAIPLAVRRKAKEAGLPHVARACLLAAADFYARAAIGKLYEGSTAAWSLQQLDAWVCQQTSDVREARWVRARLHAKVADRYRAAGEKAAARRHYVTALSLDPRMPKTVAKLLLLFCGPADVQVRAIWRRAKTRRPRNAEKFRAFCAEGASVASQSHENCAKAPGQPSELMGADH